MSIKPLIAAVAAAPLFAGAAFAGPYVNVDINLSYPDGDYNDGTTDLHVGYEGSTDKVSYCLLYTSPSPRDQRGSRMPSSA